MSSIISIINNKGGVSKTTTTFMLGTYLANKGNRVLMIDFDAQMNLSDKVGASEDNSIDYNVIDLLNGVPRPQFYTNEAGNLFTLKGSVDVDVYFNFSNSDEAEYSRKKNSLNQYKNIFKNNFDYVLIDCQPRLLSEHVLTSNEVALLVSDFVLVPATIDEDGISGFDKVLTAMKRIKPENPNLKLLGLFLTLIGNRKELLYLKIREDLGPKMGDFLFKSDIRRNTEMQQALALKMSIFDYKPNSISAQDYSEFAEEVIDKIQKLK